MSQTSPPRRPAYQRTFPGLIGAMLVVVLVVVGWAGFRALTSKPDATPVRTVEWQLSVDQAVDDGSLRVLAPPALPEGWRATSASYEPADTQLHLGLLTSSGKYVGLEESTRPLRDLVEQYVDADAVPGKDVQIGRTTWQTWTDAGGDYAVGRALAPGDSGANVYLVVGSAGEDAIHAFAGTLEEQVD